MHKLIPLFSSLLTGYLLVLLANGGYEKQCIATYIGSCTVCDMVVLCPMVEGTFAILTNKQAMLRFDSIHKTPVS